ncbi:MAG: molecular chaperone DnaJ [Bacteroidia bacterium]
MTKRDYYEILGISKDAGQDEIKKAYRKLAIKYHPDKNPGNAEAEESFKEAAEAYEILRDEQKRAAYDRFGHAGAGAYGGGGGFSGGGMSMDDIFSRFGDIFGGGGGDPFDSFFGGGRSGGGRRRTVYKGTNLRVKVKVTLQDVAAGVEKKLRLKKYLSCETCSGSGAKGGDSFSTCSTCQGSGQVRQVSNTFLGQMVTASTCPTCQGEGRVITSRCDVCHGEGRVHGEEVVTVKLPPGVKDGVQLSVSGRGNAAPRGGIAGDLIVVIEEIEHKYLKRDGSNVMFDLHIGFADAALGTEKEIPTIDGMVKIDIPAGTQGGKIFRLKHKGVPRLENGLKGDQLIHVNIYVPRAFTNQEKKILKELSKSENFQPKAESDEKGFFEKVKEMFS